MAGVRRLALEALLGVRGVLLDLSGTLHIEDTVIPGAVDAMCRLRKSGLKFRFITNTTKESKRSLLSRLNKLGFSVSPEEVYTSLTAARDLIEQKGLTPLLLLADSAAEDFNQEEELSTEAHATEQAYDSILVGLAPSKFDYDHLNKAFRVLLNGGKLIAVHKSRYYQRPDGLALGPGPFVTALEYATGQQAVVVGKPEQAFYESVLSDMGCATADTVMIGDDIYNDVEGAQKIGIKALLVRTGKYRHLDENKVTPPPLAVVEDVAAAIDTILASITQTKK